MNRSSLVASLCQRLRDVPADQIDAAVRAIQEGMANALTQGHRIEIRGFGSFASHERPAHAARNPRTGERIVAETRRAFSFKPGKELRDRVEKARQYELEEAAHSSSLTARRRRRAG